jgi:hypothetical protein
MQIVELLISIVMFAIAYMCLLSTIGSIWNDQWKRAWFFIISLGGIIVMSLSVWPGRLIIITTDIPNFLVGVPLILLWLAMPVYLALHDLVNATDRKAALVQSWGVRSFIVMFVINLIMMANIPMLIGFGISRSEFDSIVSARQVQPRRVIVTNRMFGIYFVDSYCVDERGGVYFRTAMRPYGLTSGSVSYGFAFRPNPVDCPYGPDEYRIEHLFGEWYCFESVDDKDS